MKALVLAAGRGTRMRATAPAPLDERQRAAAEAGAKGMMPIEGRPFLDYLLHALADAGVSEAALVLGPEHEEARAHYRAMKTTRISVQFVTQAKPLGTADAVLAGQAWAAGGPFLALNSDNIYPVSALAALVEARGPAVAGFERDSLGLSLERTGAFALMEEDDRRCLARIVEKPGIEAMSEAGPAALVSMNVWRFDERIFDACRDVPMSARGEKELPQAVGLAASRGVCFEVVRARGPVIDLSQRSDVGAVAARLRGMEVRL